MQFDQAKQILDSLGYRDGKLIVGKFEIPIPRAIFQESAGDQNLIEAILQDCFLDKLVMNGTLRHEAYELAIKSLQDLRDKLQSFADRFEDAGGERDRFYRSLIAVWASEAKRVGTELYSIKEGERAALASGEPRDDILFVEDCFRDKIAELRQQTLGLVSAIAELLPPSSLVKKRSEELIDKATQELIAIYNFMPRTIASPDWTFSAGQQAQT